ncbi:uncharacterized protein LOC141774683 [Sebastes fasciatus]|uniref:uncharacterized protein LOC141774683 n=1 Tax=Sebastes fasciatus TaxID=394691 RepID=UPI003D9F2284
MFQGSKRETVKLQLEDGCQAHSEVKGCTDGEENINKTRKNECQEPFIQTAYRTAKTTISCGYEGKSKVKFFCRDNGSICEDIVSTRSLWSNGTFTLTESNSSFTMSISNVSSQHAGVYWCGVERKGGCNRAALRKITLKVEVPPAAVPVVIIVIVCVAALLLLLVLIGILIYKRHSKNKRNAAAAAAAQHNTEEYMYEELRVRPQEPDSGPAMNNIYHTANFPTKPSMHYSTINFPHCSGEAGGEALTTKPSSSMCEYSTVKDSHRPTDSTVNQPSSENPLYSTINKPQEP